MVTPYTLPRPTQPSPFGLNAEMALSHLKLILPFGSCSAPRSRHYGQYNIRANAIQPASVAENSLAKHAAEDRARATTPAASLPRPKPWLPIHRAGAIREEYGATIAFLLSDDAGYITGSSLPVDGGYLAT